MDNAADFVRFSECLRHENGTLFWKHGRSRTSAGSVAGSLNREGYIKLCLDRRYVLAHRVVWLLEYGEWPSGYIDHKDGNRTNNRPDNLRVCDPQQNVQNSRPRNKLGLKGVTHLKSRRYQAQCNGHYLGIFETAEDAARAYDAAAAKTFGDFARLNFPEARP